MESFHGLLYVQTGNCLKVGHRDVCHVIAAFSSSIAVCGVVLGLCLMEMPRLYGTGKTIMINLVLCFLG